MNYHVVKVAIGNRTHTGICSCAAPIGELMTGREMKFEYNTVDINLAYTVAARYNDQRKCGCKIEVRAIE